ncbi:MAG TPA: hypothetical protein VE732_07105, partial [Nitrososphaera sp.]|nr:hypothetical protein [Nitrososphaera sp.]
MQNESIWKTLAPIIIPSIIALLCAYWQVRVMRAVANPALNQQKPERNTIRKLTRFVKEFWTLLVQIAVFSVALLLELLNPSPLTRLSVFMIAFYLAAIALLSSELLTLHLVRKFFLELLISDVETHRSLISQLRKRFMTPSEIEIVE